MLSPGMSLTHDGIPGEVWPVNQDGTGDPAMFNLVIWTLGIAVGTLVLDIVLSFGQVLMSDATGTTAFDPSGHRPKPATAWVHVTMAGPGPSRPDQVLQEPAKVA
jgi:hypothetical protein